MKKKVILFFLFFFLLNQSYTQLSLQDSLQIKFSPIIFNMPKDFKSFSLMDLMVVCYSKFSLAQSSIINVINTERNIVIIVEGVFNHDSFKISSIDNSKAFFRSEADTINHGFVRYGVNYLKHKYNADYFGGEYDRGCEKVRLQGYEDFSKTKLKKIYFQNCKVVYFSKENYGNIQVYYLYNDESKEYVESIIPKTYEIIRFKPDLN